MGWSAVGNLLYTLIVGGLGSVIALLIAAFTKFGDQLIGHALNRNMATFRHDLEREIEQLRARLGRLSDRGIRSNEREYNAIVAAWESFVEAYLAMNNCIVRLDEFADLNAMDKEQLEEWIESSRLPEGLGDMIRQARDRNQTYGKYLQYKAIKNGLQKAFDSRLVVRKQGIFIPPDLEARFIAALDLINTALAAQRAEMDGRATEMSARHTAEFSEHGPRFYDDLKNAARARMMFDETNAAMPRA